MPLTHDELARCFGRIDRFWPQAPAFTPAQVADWRRTLSRFSFDSVSDAIDFWAGAKPKYRPDLGEILSTVQEIERETSLAARQPPPFSAPQFDPAPKDSMRAGLAQARAELEKARAS